jgi:hypothetical protein
MKDVYPCRIYNGRISGILLWVDGKDQKDYFLRTNEGKIFVEKSKPSVRRKIEDKSDLNIHWDQCSVFEFDKFMSTVKSLKSGSYSKITTCKRLLDGWNFLMDFAYTIDAPEHFIRTNRRQKKIYNKLFFGNNLPSMTPKGKEYNPVWTSPEIKYFKTSINKLVQYLRLNAPELKL